MDEIIEPGDGHFFTRFVSENVCGALATIQGQTADEALSRMAANFAALPVTETTRVRADGIEDIKFIHEVVNVVVVMKPGGVRAVLQFPKSLRSQWTRAQRSDIDGSADRVRSHERRSE